ncbi:hypothetical protein CF326_g9148 [Tilletia indica]|nr:hypothetical protein CF326_g9148 [Tilletia indica]
MVEGLPVCNGFSCSDCGEIARAAEDQDLHRLLIHGDEGATIPTQIQGWTSASRAIWRIQRPPLRLPSRLINISPIQLGVFKAMIVLDNNDFFFDTSFDEAFVSYENLNQMREARKMLLDATTSFSLELNDKIGHLPAEHAALNNTSCLEADASSHM